MSGDRRLTMNRWRCYRCGRGFVHARFLVTHLIELHGEML